MSYLNFTPPGKSENPLRLLYAPGDVLTLSHVPAVSYHSFSLRTISILYFIVFRLSVIKMNGHICVITFII